MIFGVVLALLFLIVVATVLLAPVFYWTRRSEHRENGDLWVITALDSETVLDNASRTFVSDGWSVKEDRDEWIVLERGPSAGTSFLLWLLFFPLAIIYMLTNVGKGKLIVRAIEAEDETEVQISWDNAGIRSYVEEEFVRWLEDAPPRDPERAKQISSGIERAEAGDFDRALDHFDIVLHQTPRNVRVRYYRALAYAELGRQSEAVADLEKVEELTIDEGLASEVEALLDRLQR